MLADINILTMKELAFKLNIAHGTLKVYLTRIYEKVKLPGGTQRNLLLWAFVNQEKLGITVPYKEAL
jgi:DNA-binding NarL/FixJ family response regulator